MRVLVACEFSGIVRDAFRARGHDAVSCDLLPSERPGPHYTGSIERFLQYSPDQFDLLVAHPPCTYLANSGVRWLHEIPDRWEQMVEGARLVRWLLELPIPRIAVENPIMHKYARAIVGRRQDQIIQPWQFGHGETKATCLWLKGLPLLQPTDVVEGRTPRVHHASPGPDRWRERSRTLQGIADAMADQWGAL